MKVGESIHSVISTYGWKSTSSLEELINAPEGGISPLNMLLILTSAPLFLIDSHFDVLLEFRS